MNFKTNHSYTDRDLTDWYFGKAFVARCIREAKKENKKTGATSFRWFQEGTGFLTIEF